MDCCTPTIIPFTNVPTVTVAYTADMLAAYGDLPSMVVYHLSEDGVSYVKATIEVKVDDMPTTQIRIDNGGPASGFLKIFK